MTTIPPDFRKEAVLSLLENLFTDPVANLTPVLNGENSLVYTFNSGSQPLIVRFYKTNRLSRFDKEYYAFCKFNSLEVPIPAVLQYGEHAGQFYSVSARAPGQTLESLPPAEYEAVFPQVLRVLHAIHTTRIISTQGSGRFNARGMGTSVSWPAYLEAVREEAPEWDLFGRWHILFEHGFLERSLFELIYAQMLNLLTYLPQQRWLVHGNYGYKNILVDQGQVSAVLGWGDACYGDFMYDIAWLSYYAPYKQIPERFMEFYAQQGIEVPHFAERLLCHQLYISLDAMRQFAKANNYEKYEWVHARALQLMNPSPGLRTEEES